MAKNSTDDRETISGVTPVGTVVFSHLTEPDYTFAKEGSYNVKLRLSESDAMPLLDKARELIDEELQSAKAACKTKLEVSKLKMAEDLPIRAELDENAEPTGFYILGAKMAASGVTKTGKEWTRKPVIYDARGKALDTSSLSIWSGSEIRVAYAMRAFNVPSLGIGVSLRLEAAQIIKLVSGTVKSAEGYGFTVVEDGYAAEPEPERTWQEDPEKAYAQQQDGGEGDY
jgi:hypothetical protein